MVKLKFGLGNAKLNKNIATFSLPAGHACPFAKLCKSSSDRVTGFLTDGPDTEFRCFSASSECRAPAVRNQRWHNFELLKAAKTVQGMADLIQNSLPLGINIIRLHVSGDFFNENYFKAWLNVAIANPHIVFYTYTKSLKYWIKYKKFMPDNFRLTASIGGTNDSIIKKYNLVYAQVVYSQQQADELGLQIDHDDSLAMAATKPFALLLHGCQPKGTAANEAWKIIKATIGGYSRENQKRKDLSEEKHVSLAVV